MDTEKIKELIALMDEAGLAELEVAKGDERIRIARSAAQPAAAPARPPEASTGATNDPPPAAKGVVVAAPLSGTFYRAPAPGEQPFVAVGDTVAMGDVLCIIESMKMMNQVKSDRAGAVAEVLLQDGQAIETGTGLFRIL